MRIQLVIKIIMFIYMLITALYIGYNLSTGIERSEIKGSIENIIETKCDIIEESTLGTTEVILFQTKKGLIGYGIYEKAVILNRYHKERVRLFHISDLDNINESNIVDGGWNRYSIKLTPITILVEKIHTSDGRYVDELKIAIVSFLISIGIVLLLKYIRIPYKR